MRKKSLAIVILNWNGTDDTVECLKSLYPDRELYDIFLLDNASEEEKRERLLKFLPESGFSHAVLSAEEFLKANSEAPECTVVLSAQNLGFARGNNFIGYRIYPRYDYLLLLNNDTEVPPETIPHMLRTIREKKDIAITCDIRYFSDKDVLWNAGGNFRWYGDRKYFSQRAIDRKIARGVGYRRAEFITGCALMVDCGYIREYGLLTEKFFHGEEDYNFCYLAKRRGKTLGVDLAVRLYHKVGRSINADGDGDRALRASVVHYTNRILDYKQYYGKLRWRCWKRFYLFLIGVKRRLAGMDGGTVRRLKERINFYASRYDDVRYEVFRLIMSDGEIHG